MKKTAILLFSLLALTACGDSEAEKNAESTKKSNTQETTDTSGDTVSSASVKQDGEVTKVTWNTIPKEGLISGDYYRMSERFRQGHEGILEVVVKDDKLEYIYFNEYTRPNYYNRYFQNVSKRMSEYNISMKEAKGAAWIEGVLLAEEQMTEKQSLTEDVDTVSGASNSVEQALVPMAKKLNEEIVPSKDFDGPTFYQLTKDLGDGIYGILKVVIEDKKITDLHYDEVFSTDPDKITEEKFKRFASLSKYDSVEYDEASRIGFNVQMDALTEQIKKNQDMLNIEGLPATENTGDYKSSGYTERNPAWDNYLSLAEEIQNTAKKDGKL